MSAISIKNLTFKYKSWTSKKLDNVFENLNLDLYEGEKVLILANSDQGKTTLSRLLSNLLLKFIPSSISGEIKIFNENIDNFEPYDLVDKICYVSQNPMEMFITTTVENEIAFPFETMGFDRQLIIKKVNTALKEWGLERYRDVSPTELSGGERKRLLLAITFALDTKIILLDEAYDDLDSEYRSLLSNKIKESNNSVIVLSARYLSQFENVFNNIYVLEDKKLKKSRNYKNNFTHKDVTYYLSNSHLIKDYDDRIKNIKIKQHSLSVENLEIERIRESSKANGFKLNCSKFFIKTGEIVRLVGKNGSGKSTLSRVLCGLDSPLDGNIYLNGEKIDNSLLQTKVAYLFQNPDLQIFLPTVYEELAYGLENNNLVKKSDIKSKVENCAKLFNLKLDETPSTMSFAYRKFLQAAVYYLLDRPFIIFDEIDGAMSYEDAYYIIDKLSLRGAAIIIITHDDSFAKSICDREYITIDNKVEELNNE